MTEPRAPYVVPHPAGWWVLRYRDPPDPYPICLVEMVRFEWHTGVLRVAVDRPTWFDADEARAVLALAGALPAGLEWRYLGKERPHEAPG